MTPNGTRAAVALALGTLLACACPAGCNTSNTGNSGPGVGTAGATAGTDAMAAFDGPSEDRRDVLVAPPADVERDACVAAEGQPCGGNILGACVCAAGFACVREGGPPVGDVGGICVPGASDAGT